MKILKFGGKSLANGDPLDRVIEIVKKELAHGPVALVVSARGEATDQLLEMYELAAKGESFIEQFKRFRVYQEIDDSLSIEFQQLLHILEALKKLTLKNCQIKDKVLAFGEVLAAKTLAKRIEKSGRIAIFKDAREIIFTHSKLGEQKIDFQKSELKTKLFFESIAPHCIPVITGFIATNEDEETITLGRNGSNYSATLIANFIEATAVQNWTDIDGVYSANPKYVNKAQKIPHLSYEEANELANFGVNVLHPKTIEPLKEKGIPLWIFNSFDTSKKGTLIDENGGGKGIKAVSVVEGVALITLEGKGLSGRVGIDGRVFSLLSQNDISVRLISQASSERGIGFVVNKEVAREVKQLLEREFETELEKGTLTKITVNENTAIIAIVGRHNYALEKAIKGLRNNKIWMYLISNSISGDHISLVIDNKDLKKAVNVVHSQVFGVIKTINVFCLGKGVVGATLIDQIINTDQKLVENRRLKVNVIGVADSKKYVINTGGLDENWKIELNESNQKNVLSEVLNRLKESHLENIVIADNTSSQEVTDYYPNFLNAGFDIVASNKKLNSGTIEKYEEVQQIIQSKGRLFYYETNVGAGLPIIDTLKHLKESADEITRVRGVFSGSLSYIFNSFSISDGLFSEVLLEAKEKGYTEPDPREDLCGLDVARKLVILSREIGLKVNLDQVKIQNLIPSFLQKEVDYESFIAKKNELDEYYLSIQKSLAKGKVLRYVGDLDVSKEELKVSLVEVDERSSLGNIKGADSIFEVYTSAYGNQPVVIQGAGAGGAVTARGVYSDLIRMGREY